MNLLLNKELNQNNVNIILKKLFQEASKYNNIPYTQKADIVKIIFILLYIWKRHYYSVSSF